jgi:Zn-dependent peptidase ImmA (M78 family)/DNA-binding XRE family transcriptional regulator
MPAFNGKRLGLARCRRGLTKVALANAAGLTARRIAAFENEGEVPSETTLQALADVLDFPLSFFALADPPVPEPEGVSFRSFSRLPSHRRDAALAAASLAVEIARWIDQRFQLPEIDVPDLRDVDPKTAAAVVRASWSLGNDPAPNVVRLLEAHGVRVYSLVDDCADLDALSMWWGHTPFVFLTHHKSPERGRWDAAHELGHLVLHLDGPPQGREQEREADLFASEFLLPEHGVRASAPRFPSFLDVRREKTVWRVSALAYIRTLFNLQLISEWQYRSLVIEASQAGYRRKEGDIDRESSQLIPKVVSMLKQEGISLNQFADEIGLRVNDLRGLLVSSLAVVQGEGTRPGNLKATHLRVV